MAQHFDKTPSPYILSVKHGLTLAIPFLILGSFALLLKSFPIKRYQAAVIACMDGSFIHFLDILYNITLGSLALILIITISLSSGNLMEREDIFFYPIVALCSYLVFCGGLQEQGEYIFAAEWVFSAMCITMLSCALFRGGIQLSKKLGQLHTIGADYSFNLAIRAILPIVVITILFALLGGGLRLLTGNTNITNFGSFLFLKLFSHMGKTIFSVLLYVFFSHLLWFFGIHGTNTLEEVARNFFEQGVDANQALIQAGQMPTEIYSKTFLDTFAFMGGCGTAICLILALFLVAKKHHNRRLAKVACPLVLFNISEIVIFGFPVIFNAAMLIPFICTPLILVLVSSAAMELGLVPLVTSSVEWTVPAIVSGYQATGSIAGSILQIVNIIIGTCIYIPFVKFGEKRQSEEFSASVVAMEADMAKGEESGILPSFMSSTYAQNHSAKTLSLDLKAAMGRGEVQLYYQVQVQGNESVYGAEALLRWKHPVVGYVSPPLLISMAYEGRYLSELGYYLIEKTCQDIERMNQVYGGPMHISVNLSPHQLEEDDFLKRVMEILGRYNLGEKKLVFEITERVVMRTSGPTIDKIRVLREHGVEISMDDFGMGHGSMVYLQNNSFDEVKLDGKIVRQLLENERSQNIVEGIVKMAQTLNFQVVAEYVENEKVRDLLKQLGCNIYQGYYYGRPQPLDAFIESFLSQKDGKH